MKLFRMPLFALALAAWVGLAGPARADYPDRPIRIVVPYPPGGTTDLLARALAPRLGERLNQTVLVDNRPGAGGVIGAQAVSRSPADGYTLVFGTIATHGILPVLQKPAPYDALKDFAPSPWWPTRPTCCWPGLARASAAWPRCWPWRAASPAP